MSRTVFSPSHSALDTIFTSGTTYVIPAYQRPYSWQALGKTDTNNQVNQMWDDLWSFFCENQGSDKEYFLGSMVIIEKRLRAFEVVDGQQRLTTIALLLGAMRCFLREAAAEPELEQFRARAELTLETLLFNREGVDLVQSAKLKIERATGYDFDRALNDAIDCRANIADTDPQNREIAERYFKNRDYFIDRLRAEFLTEGRFTTQDATRFNKFFAVLNARVSIVLISTTDFETAYFIFETLNNRGLPLSGRDLLRNFIIKGLAEAKHEHPADVWTSLESDYALTEDFMGRWVESTNAAQARTSAFTGMVNLYEQSGRFAELPGKPKITAFCDTLRDDLERYTLLMEAEQRVQDVVIRNKLRLLRTFGNERYSRNYLLTLFRHFDYRGESSEIILDALCAFQRWMLHVMLTPGVRFSNSVIYAAIRALKDGRAEDSLAEFALDAQQQARLIALIGGDLPDNSSAKIVVATHVWREEAMHPDVVEQRLDYDKATLEHIIPQQPAAGSRWHVDFDDEFRRQYTYKLGNMTLLTSRMNSSARNSEFVEKKKRYRQTLLPLTRVLAEQPALTPEFIRARHDEMVASVLADLRLTS